jgi:DNA-binding NarL/FixJ family response regulator
MKRNNKIRLAFADDHAVVRDGLRALFKSEPAFTVVGEAADGEHMVSLVTRLKPDVAILDISMPKLTGIEATRIIKKEAPETKVLILTIHESEEFVFELIHSGADGYVLKNAEKQEILSAVRAVEAGERFFSPSVSKLLIDGAIKRTQESPGVSTSPRWQLTSRETEVLRHIAEGLTSREIAERLHISFSTVNSHRTNLMKKLDIHETAGLVRYAIQHRVVTVMPNGAPGEQGSAP